MCRSDLTSNSCNTIARIISSTALHSPTKELVDTDLVRATVRRLIAHCINEGMVFAALVIAELLLPIPELSDCFPIDLGEYVSSIFSSNRKTIPSMDDVIYLWNLKQTLESLLRSSQLKPSHFSTAETCNWIVGEMKHAEFLNWTAGVGFSISCFPISQN